ncbi:MAG TPA: lipocalin family protein [Thermomonas sp.]|nr:lipocalin family protein [Thermomonas sp.]HOZ23578.1 lipocalin family protein [Thermomonas sp.]HPM55576.1 lipocalin family protein [Thermomonas sp.]
MRKLLVALGIGTLLAACASTPPTIPPVASVDLPRFMGDWYVIAQIPTYIERKAFDSVESYRLDEDGKIRTTFRYRNGSADAPLKTMEPVGRVVPGTNNAVWEMQFVWPIQAEYVIVDLAPDYSRTIVGRSKRDYVWLMARTPSLPAPELAAAIEKIRVLGYDTAKLRMVPQAAANAPAP